MLPSKCLIFMESTASYTFTVRWLPPVVTAGCFTVVMSSPTVRIDAEELALLALLQLLVSGIALQCYAILSRRVYHRKWLSIFAPLSLLLIPLPLYALLYGIVAWSELPLLRLVGGDGVFGMISWVFMLSLFAYGMMFTGNALLKNAVPFPQSRMVSLLSGLASLIFGAVFFLPGTIGALADDDMGLLCLLLPPGLLFVIPPLVCFLKEPAGRKSVA